VVAGFIAKIPAPSSTPAIAPSGGLVNGASFQAGIVPNSWITIYGTNLASKTDTWDNAVVNGVLPPALDGVVDFDPKTGRGVRGPVKRDGGEGVAVANSRRRYRRKRRKIRFNGCEHAGCCLSVSQSF